jgi:arylsulfatase A-like enzyme
LDRTTLLPRFLREAGYRTGLVGKLLNSWPVKRRPPYFDRWASGGESYFDPTFNVNGTVRTIDGYATTIVGRFATRFLQRFERDDSAPWLLYVAPFAPHHPWLPDARHRNRPVGRWSGNPAVRESDRSDKPAYVRSLHYSLDQGRAVRAGQLRTLMSVDRMVGRVVSGLRKLGEGRRTLAIFTSDNGFVWADHHLGGARGTAGQKRLPYTPSIRVPFFVRWPGHLASGSRSARITGTVDITPTVLDAAGLDVDSRTPPLDGRSLLSGERRRRIVLEYWRGRHSPSIPTWASLRTRKYQYVEYYRHGKRFFREYYNLVRDPWQLRNLIHDGDLRNNPDVDALSRLLRHDRRCKGTVGRTACP